MKTHTDVYKLLSQLVAFVKLVTEKDRCCHMWALLIAMATNKCFFGLIIDLTRRVAKLQVHHRYSFQYQRIEDRRKNFNNIYFP